MWAFPSGSASGAAATVRANWRNTDSRPFYIEALGAALTGGAAQYPVKWSFQLIPPESASTGFRYLDGGELVSTTAAESNFIGSRSAKGIIVPPLWYISCFARFNAGAAANAVTMDVLGWFFSRGTLALP